MKKVAADTTYKSAAQVVGSEAQVAYRVGTAATGSIGKGFAAGVAGATIGVAGVAGGLAGDYAGSKVADYFEADGVDRQAIETSSGYAGAMGAGAGVGMLVAGPAGAAAGAVLGAGGQTVGNMVSGFVDCFYSDDRYDFGAGLGMTCSLCGAFCQNRGCKACNKNYCEACYPKHRKNKHST